MTSGGFFRILRIFLLLIILIGVGMGTWVTRARTTSWRAPLWVVVYPVNADGSAAASTYLDSLGQDTFGSIEWFMAREARRYSPTVGTPVTIRVAPEVRELPPEPPRNRSMLKTVWWSLRFRFWAYRVDTYDGPPRDIRVFVLYYDPAAHAQLDESFGLQKGMACVAKAFADWRMEEENNIVIAHELLHTVGATDKYDLTTNQPSYPDGYADPGKIPRFPQQVAEIMAGRIPITETQAELPESLINTVIGEKTAREIKWIDHN